MFGVGAMERCGNRRGGDGFDLRLCAAVFFQQALRADQQLRAVYGGAGIFGQLPAAAADERYGHGSVPFLYSVLKSGA